MDTWEVVSGLAEELDARSELPPEQRWMLQVLKIQEEAGEVAEAVIGALGLNPRKGHSHSWGDVEGEICDVIVTGMVALQRIAPDNPRAVFEQHLADVVARGLDSPPADGR